MYLEEKSVKMPAVSVAFVGAGVTGEANDGV